MAVRAFEPNFIGHTINAGISGAVANQFIQINLKGGLIFGACAELSSLVARYVVSFFSSDGAIVRTAARVGRVLGGHYLGNMALQAAGFVPLAFTPATILIPLAAPFVVQAAYSITKDLWKATLGQLIPRSESTYA